MTADDGEKLLVRSKTIYDGAIPSGNSVAVFNLLRLGHMTGEAGYLTKAERIIKSFAAEMTAWLPKINTGTYRGRTSSDSKAPA